MGLSPTASMTSGYALVLQSQAFNVIQNDQSSIKVPQRSSANQLARGPPDENLASRSNLLGDCRTVFTPCLLWRKRFQLNFGQFRSSAQCIADSEPDAGHGAFAFAHAHR